MASATLTLDEEDVESYHRDGFLQLPRVAPDDEIEALKAVYDRLFTTETRQEDRKELADLDEEGNETLPQILAPRKLAPELLETQYFDNAQAIARQLLGEDAEFTGDHAIRKPAHGGAETPWHQDEAYWNPALKYESLSFWMPFQEATVENGCMQFVPESHTHDVLPHHTLPGAAEGLEVDDVDEYVSDAVACELAAGEATVHSSRTLHYTGPNRTDEPRRAYILTFGLPTETRDQPRDFYWQE